MRLPQVAPADATLHPADAPCCMREAFLHASGLVLRRRACSLERLSRRSITFLPLGGVFPEGPAERHRGFAAAHQVDAVLSSEDSDAMHQSQVFQETVFEPAKRTLSLPGMCTQECTRRPASVSHITPGHGGRDGRRQDLSQPGGRHPPQPVSVVSTFPVGA